MRQVKVWLTSQSSCACSTCTTRRTVPEASTKRTFRVLLGEAVVMRILDRRVSKAGLAGRGGHGVVERRFVINLMIREVVQTCMTRSFFHCCNITPNPILDPIQLTALPGWCSAVSELTLAVSFKSSFRTWCLSHRSIDSEHVWGRSFLCQIPLHSPSRFATLHSPSPYEFSGTSDRLTNPQQSSTLRNTIRNSAGSFRTAFHNESTK